MKLVFFSNYLNHHQVLVADEFYRLLGDNFRFVATLPVNEMELKGGADYTKRPYCILAAENDETQAMALSLSREAEVCVFGACSQEFAVERAKHNPKALSFEMGERWLKHGLLTIGSPIFRKWFLNYLRYYRRANFYKLCCSSYTSIDDRRVYAYLNRHYKWGYFTDVSNACGEDLRKCRADTNSTEVRLMWCARLLKLKHPELPVILAAKLKKEGYRFVINIYGDEKNLLPSNKVYSSKDLKSLIDKLGVADVVNMKGSYPNSQILQAMREHDIFLFTSDRNEGWGVVANEAMSNNCCLVSSDAIGSSHYLLNDGVNGFIFKNRSIESLYDKVKYLFDHPLERKIMAERGAQDMFNIWSPKVAAKNLLQLIRDLNNGHQTSIIDGPCSKA